VGFVCRTFDFVFGFVFGLVAVAALALAGLDDVCFFTFAATGLRARAFLLSTVVVVAVTDVLCRFVCGCKDGSLLMILLLLCDLLVVALTSPDVRFRDADLVATMANDIKIVPA